MDIYLNRRERDNNYFLALAHSAANDLMKTAKIVSSRHIKDFFLKARFESEVKQLSDGNLNIIRNAKTDSECRAAISNIQEECANIERQGTMLSLDRAKVYITINMEKYNNEIGYTINAIGVVGGGLQAISGAGLIVKSGFVIGKLAGAHLTLSGASTVAEKVYHLLGQDNYVGFMEKGYRITAKFMGFEPKAGSMAYHAVDMASSLYGVVALSLKPDVWRLYKYIPSDYYRNFTKMSQGALMLKFAGAGNKIRIISDINNHENVTYIK
ncbi:DUF4225 domain-containing protein [Yersinia enterocolitica]|uniref:DUF4225 domain-containing protein n=1 Tax=Yersinia enterocolitica TaxID=630 RepID=UPI0027FC8972|nr:DUF4225 domain-containing protein [Yersinia enterocolitica]EKN6334241.1 DUF4225 domain-containing protein [Yersinia enterocolitica]HDT6097160.1 DUF4225 domain-containing protein [Yersinia enterocolitica]HEI6815579.1 DUF4225 domain-containing protein [Yersinia enterocolitica]